MGNRNFKKVMKVLWIILFANLGVALFKIVIGSIIKSTSMTADGFHSLADGSSNVVGLIGIYFASKPVDKEHQYGHGKFETIAGLFISTMLFFIGGKIIADAIIRFINPVTPHVTIEGIISLLATLAINVIVCIYEYSQGKKLNSYILMSDSMHTRSDIYVSIGVIVTLVCVRLGLPPVIDPIASLVVSIFIFHASYEIFKSTSDVLVDRAVIDNERIREIVMTFKKVKGVHKIRNRGSEDDIYIDMHILTEPDMSVEESHNLIHSIEKKMQEEINDNIQIIVHIEPFYENRKAV